MSKNKIKKTPKNYVFLTSNFNRNKISIFVETIIHHFSCQMLKKQYVSRWHLLLQKSNGFRLSAKSYN